MNSLIYRYPTHLSISHSFLDKYIIGLLQGVLRRGNLNGPTAGITVGTVGRVGQCIITHPSSRLSSLDPLRNIPITQVISTGHHTGYINRSSHRLYQPVISQVISTGHHNKRVVYPRDSCTTIKTWQIIYVKQKYIM